MWQNRCISALDRLLARALSCLPAGCYRAVLREVSTGENDDGDLVLRMLYDIVRGENGPVKHVAALEYPAGRDGHAKLNKDLEAFFQQDELDRLQGMPAEVDLMDFVGDEVDLAISFHTGSDFAPYSTVTGIFCAGSITGKMLASSSGR